MSRSRSFTFAESSRASVRNSPTDVYGSVRVLARRSAEIWKSRVLGCRVDEGAL